MNIYAKNIFISFGAMGSNGENREYYLDNNDELSFGNIQATSVFVALGTEIEFDNENLRIEPTLGYRLYNIESYFYKTRYIELPLLYKFFLGGQQISVGPNYKIFYNSDITDSYQTYSTNGSKVNSAYGFKVLFEYQYVDLLVSYEYLTEKVNFFGYNGSTVVDGYLDMRGSYVGYGIRFKY